MKNIARKTIFAIVALTFSGAAIAGSGAGVGLERTVNGKHQRGPGSGQMTMTEQTHARPMTHFTERPQPRSALHGTQQEGSELKARMDSAAFRMLSRERNPLLFGLE